MKKEIEIIEDKELTQLEIDYFKHKAEKLEEEIEIFKLYLSANQPSEKIVSALRKRLNVRDIKRDIKP